MALYDMNKKVPKEGNGSAYLEPGIYENIVLKDVVATQSPNGNPFLAFYFSDENGNVVPKTEWQPNGDNVETKVENQMKRVKHIAVNSGLLTEEEFIFQAEDFEDFTKKIEEKLKSKKDKWNDCKLRIKVVYDWNNYTTLPNYTKYTWLENMQIPREQSKIKILGIDKMERDVPDTTADTSQQSPFNDSDENSPF